MILLKKIPISLPNVVLLILVIAISFAYFIKQSSENKDSFLLADAPYPKSVSLIFSEITLTFERLNSNWKMTKPFKAWADNLMVNQIASLFETKIGEMIGFIGNDNLASFGLQPSIAEIYLDNKLIEIGSKNTVIDQRYLRFQNRVYTVNNQALATMRRNPFMYLSRALLTPDMNPVHISVFHSTDKESSFSVTKTEKGYTLESKINKTNKEQLANWFSNMSYILASTVTPSPVPPKDFKRLSSITITLTDKQGDTITYYSIKKNQLLRKDIAEGLAYELNDLDFQRLIKVPTLAGTSGS